MREEFKKWWEENGCRGRDYAVANCPIKNLTPYFIQKYLKEFHEENAEITDYSTRLATKVQKFADTNRIERKSFRDNARVSNALEEYNEQITIALKSIKPFTIKHEVVDNTAIGFIQLSDLHLNELIDIEGNKYDFNVAAQRLKLLAIKAKKYLNGIKNVVIGLTGDILNNDIILDKLLNQATNRAKATVLSFYLLEQFILDLNSEFNISIVGVTGNEGRAKKELGYSEILATDNYDFTILNMLKVAFRNSSINFIDSNGSEQIINIANNNVLIMHGLSIKNDIEKSIQQTIGKYATKGIIIDYVFIGHIHSARIGDLYARSSSMCGANAYSDYGLNLASRASQNLAIFYNNKSHDVFKIDLQNCDKIQGYKIIKELEAYNAKSVDKCKENTPIFTIVI